MSASELAEAIGINQNDEIYEGGDSVEGGAS